MVFIHSLSALAALLLSAQAHRVRHRHEAFEVERRQGGPIMPPPGVSASMTSTSSGVLTYITPSPGASPIAVTSQSQLVTSYVPQFTLCALPPDAEVFATPVPSVKPSSAPYANYSVSYAPGNGTCKTIYSQTETMVCDTTLSALVTSYPVTQCNQEITFSSQYGYSLIMPTPTPAGNLSANATSPSSNMTANATAMITPAPSIETLTTYYLAPWQQLTAATAPSNVNKKVCFTATNGSEECISEYQVWHTSLVAYNATSTFPLNISTTISGPSQIVVATYVANITETMTTFSMSTTIETEYSTQYTTTHVAPASVSTAPTVFETLTVDQVSSTVSGTSTTTVRLTITTHVGTTTVYMPSASSTPTST